jgi:hypothetical protein
MRPIRGRFFVHFFPGKISGKISGKIFPQKCWEKMEFSTEKVLKNRFSKKFRVIFRGKSLSAEKNVRKIAQSGYPGAEKTGVK